MNQYTHKMLRPIMTILLMIFIIVGPAKGQIATIDVSNIVQTTLTAFQTAEIVANTLNQIENQIFMIENQITNLQNLDITNLGSLTSLFSRVLNLLSQANGITYSASRIDQEFSDLYPVVGLPAAGGAEFIEQLRTWNQQARNAVQDAMRSQSIQESIENDSMLILDAVARSDASAGNLSVLQAGNQIDGLNAAQLIRMQEILAAVHRDQASKRAMDTAINDAALANAQHMLEGFTDATDVTPNAMPALSY